MVTGEKAEHSGTDAGRLGNLAMRRGDGFLLNVFVLYCFCQRDKKVINEG